MTVVGQPSGSMGVAGGQSFIGGDTVLPRKIPEMYSKCLNYLLLYQIVISRTDQKSDSTQNRSLNCSLQSTVCPNGDN